MDWNLQEAMAYYKKLGAPADQSVLIQLLREVQQETGGSISLAAVGEIAQCYSVKESLILAIIKRIPSLRLNNLHTLELCAGPNCGKHTTLAALAETLHRGSGKAFQLKFVPCMRQCGKGPNVKWDGKLYNKAEEALLRQFLQDAGIKF